MTWQPGDTLYLAPRAPRDGTWGVPTLYATREEAQAETAGDLDVLEVQLPSVTKLTVQPLDFVPETP